MSTKFLFFICAFLVVILAGCTTQSELIIPWDSYGCDEVGTECYCCDDTPYLLQTRYDTCTNIMIGGSGANPVEVCGGIPDITDKSYDCVCVDESQKYTTLNTQYSCCGYVIKDSAGGIKDFYCDIDNFHLCQNGCDKSTGECNDLACTDGFMKCVNDSEYICTDKKWTEYMNCAPGVCKQVSYKYTMCYASEKTYYCPNTGAIDCMICSDPIKGYDTAEECRHDNVFWCLLEDKTACIKRMGGCEVNEQVFRYTESEQCGAKIDREAAEKKISDNVDDKIARLADDITSGIADSITGFFDNLVIGIKNWFIGLGDGIVTIFSNHSVQLILLVIGVFLFVLLFIPGGNKRN